MYRLLVPSHLAIQMYLTAAPQVMAAWVLYLQQQQQTLSMARMMHLQQDPHHYYT
jgi:hypothetical protein